jgi:predicted transposase YdaD
VEAMLGLQFQDSRILREAKAEGGHETALAIVLRLIARRLGTLDDQMQGKVEQLSSGQLEDLSEALLDFATLADLEAWLDAHPAQEGGNPE